MMAVFAPMGSRKLISGRLNKGLVVALQARSPLRHVGPGASSVHCQSKAA